MQITKKSGGISTGLFTVLMLVLILVGIVNIMNLTANDDDPDKKKKESEGLTYKIISPPLPEYVDFCGEEMKLDDFEVYERLDNEIIVNTFRHSSTIRYIKRAWRWFPLIEDILKEKGVPDDFKYLCIAESGLANVISPAKATGFWQFLKRTAQQYGLEVNKEVDERYHVEKSTYAACDYLLDAYKKFGSWTLAAAAYNAGVGGVSNRVEKQKVNNYYDLLLVEETARYIPRIVALKIIFNNPELYGFYISEDTRYKPIKTKTVELTGKNVDLVDYAISLNITYKTLKELNPWLRDDVLTNKSGKTYEIKIPAGS